MKRKKGAALIMVIVTMVVLAILGTVLLEVSLVDTKSAVRDERKTQAHYLGRSGVYYGIEILKNKLDATTFTTVENLISTLGEYNLTITDIGTANVKFELFSPEEVKIMSTGLVTKGTNNISELVTLIIRIDSGLVDVVNPREWVAGINLRHSVKKGEKYIGQGVKLVGKPIQIPSNKKGSESFFQATAIYFANHSGISLKQINNTIPFSVDAEYLYFESGIELNDNVGDSVKLLISPEIRNKDSSVLPKHNEVTIIDNSIPPPNETSVSTIGSGLEKYERYLNYLGIATRDANLSSDSNYQTYYSKYESRFTPGSSYGIIYVGDQIYTKKASKILIELDDDNSYTHTNYYFFKDGTDLKNIETNDFISICQGDPIINVLKGLNKPSIITESKLWNNK